jgi:hypothetical protein
VCERRGPLACYPGLSLAEARLNDALYGACRCRRGHAVHPPAQVDVHERKLQLRGWPGPDVPATHAGGALRCRLVGIRDRGG